MTTTSRLVALAVGAALLVGVGGNSASAQRWGTIDGCYDAVEGIGRGTGAFGRGTQRARYAARRDWERNASSRYGRAYGNLSRADDVQWDCKKNAVLLAKCVVIAKPCRARMRG
jgi:hypothetical protein